MLKISKLAEYGSLIMTHFVLSQTKTQSARAISASIEIAIPTVCKLLKLLVQGRVLTSIRGAHGGYTLAKSAGEISLADIIRAIDGKIAITDCSSKDFRCIRSHTCPIGKNWCHLNQTITDFFQHISLEDFATTPQIFTFKIQRENLKGNNHD